MVYESRDSDPTFRSAPMAVLAHFAEQFLRDESNGELRSIGDYRAMYPGWERDIELEFGRLRDSEPSHGPTGGEPDEVRRVDFGSYELQEELGRGGQAVVYRALDRLLGTPVAVKLLTASASPTALLRFRREGQILARLDHASLCPVHTAGVFDGQPYLAMKFIDGAPLSRVFNEWRDAKSRPIESPALRERALALLEPIAWALHRAHVEGVVHRDVKPANILIDRATQRPYLVDFGFAGDDQDSLAISGSLDRLGTPAYMAPEQSDGPTNRVDGRADIYSLGVVLHEAMTLSSRRRGDRGVELREVRADPDLHAVIETATARDPSERYASAEQLAHDLLALRIGAGVSVRRASPVLRVRRWARLNPAIATFASLLMLTLTAGLVATTLLLSVANESERRATHALDSSEWNRARMAIAAAQRSFEAGDRAAAAQQLAQCPGLHRDFAWRHLAAKLDSSFRTHKPDLGRLDGVFIVQGALVASGDRGLARAHQSDWDVLSGERGVVARPVRSHPGRWSYLTHTDTGLNRYDFDGLHPRPAQHLSTTTSRIVSACRVGESALVSVHHDGTVRHCSGNAMVLDVVADLSVFGTPTKAALSPDGRTLAVACAGPGGLKSEVVVLGWPECAVVARLPSPRRAFTALAFSDDCQRIWTATKDLDERTAARVAVWDLRSGELLARCDAGCDVVRAVLPDPSDERVFVGAQDGGVRAFDGGLERSLGTLFGHREAITSLVWSQEHVLATTSEDGHVKLWSTEPFGVRYELQQNRDGFFDLLIDDAETLWTGVSRPRVDSWDLSTATRTVRALDVPHTSLGTRGRGTLAMFGAGRWSRLDTNSGAVTSAPRPERLANQFVGFLHPSRPWLYATDQSTYDLLVHDWDGDHEPRRLVGLGGMHLSGGASDAGEVVAASCDAGHCCVWSSKEEKPKVRYVDGEFEVVAVSSNGRWVALGGERRVDLLDTESWDVRRSWSVSQRVRALAFDPIGHRLAVASERAVTLFGTAYPGVVARFDQLDITLDAIAWAPDGRRLVAAGFPGRIVVWSTASATPVRPERPKHVPTTLSPARWFAHASEWRSATFRERLQPMSVFSRPFLPRRIYQIALEAAELGITGKSSGTIVGAGYFRTGRLERANELLRSDAARRLNQRGNPPFMTSAFLAMVSSARGHPTDANAWLERAVAEAAPSDTPLLAEARMRVSADGQQALRFLDERTPLTGAEAERLVRSAPELDAAARVAAGEAVQLVLHTDRILALFAWLICLSESPSKEAGAEARRWAIAAASQRPSQRVHQTIAVASLRTGDASTAVRELRELAQSSKDELGEADPQLLAFLALAEFAAGDGDAAQRTRNRFTVAANRSTYAGDRVLGALARELRTKLILR